MERLCRVPCCYLLFFFCKQKTAYEMRISDWSSDVCSSDLVGTAPADSAHLLAAGPAQGLAVSRPGREQADRRPGAVFGVPLRLRRGGPRQAGDGAHAAPQLRHASSGGRHRQPLAMTPANRYRPIERSEEHPSELPAI